MQALRNLSSRAAVQRLAFAIVLVTAATAAPAQETKTMTTKLASPYAFDDTLARLRATLTSHGMTIFATVDHAAGARAAGLAMPPTVVVIYGNPKGGTPLMQAAPDVALDLPLRVLVRSDDQGHAWLVYDPVSSLEGRHGLPAGMSERLAPAEKLLALAVQ